MAEKCQKLAFRFGKLLLRTNRSNAEKALVNYYFTYSPEPAQPLQKDPKWTSAEEAVNCIKSGSYTTCILIPLLEVYVICN